MYRKQLSLLSNKLILIMSLILAVPTFAATSDTKNSANFNRDSLAKTIKAQIGLDVIEINQSPFPGIAEVIAEQGLFYTSYDGNFLIQGKMYQFAGENVTDVTEKTMAKIRLKGVEKFEKDMIVYPAKNEKHVISVFTDITCGYCRKMHEQMEQYNDLGITVRYLAYPRAGIVDRAGNYTQGFEDLRSVWCHEDPSTALTKAKAGRGVAQRICQKPVAEEFNFGRQIGVTGTPAIILENGDLRPGYLPPEALIQVLERI